MSLKTYKKEILFGAAIIAMFGLLLYLETHLPFFAKFLPVGREQAYYRTAQHKPAPHPAPRLPHSKDYHQNKHREKAGRIRVASQDKTDAHHALHLPHFIVYAFYHSHGILLCEHGQVVWTEDRRYHRQVRSSSPSSTTRISSSDTRRSGTRLQAG